MSKGKLVYVMGPSGSGKDSIMDGALAELPREKFVFVKRYITRPEEAGGEDHISLSKDEFQKKKDQGQFVMTWESHGNSYGITREINEWLAEGKHVVMNGSRGYFDQAVRDFPDIIPVLITVNMDVLEDRLISRGRESAAEVKKRLERASSFQPEHSNLVTIDNSGSLQKAINSLNSFLRSLS